MADDSPEPPYRPGRGGCTNPIGRPPGSLTIADCSLRLKMESLSRFVWTSGRKTVADPKGDFWEKMAASKELMNRAFGEPPRSIEAHF